MQQLTQSLELIALVIGTITFFISIGIWKNRHDTKTKEHDKRILAMERRIKFLEYIIRSKFGDNDWNTSIQNYRESILDDS